MAQTSYLAIPPALEGVLPSGVERELLLAELRQAFVAEAKLGTAIVNPKRIALRLIADGHTPAAARWLIREGRVGTCVARISPRIPVSSRS